MVLKDQTTTLLSQFQNNISSINGNLDQLLTYRNIGGGMNAIFEPTLIVVPNPNNGIFNLEVTGIEEAKFYIYNSISIILETWRSRVAQ